MKIDQLTYFLEAAKQEHLGKAAKILNISPSAVSHSIASLEYELGRPLFLRKGKNILLTSHGKRLMERSQELLERVQAIQEEMSSENIELQGHLKIAGSHLLCESYLSIACAEVQNKHPALSCEIYTLRSSQVHAGVVGGDYDLGLCFSPQSHPDIQVKPLYTGTLECVVRKNHPVLKLPAKQRLQALSQYPAALPKAFQGIETCESHPCFDKFQIAPKVTFMFDSYRVVLEKIARSDTWALFPDLVTKEAGAQITALPQPVGWNAPYNISLIWPKQRYLSRALTQIVSCLTDQLEKEKH